MGLNNNTTVFSWDWTCIKYHELYIVIELNWINTELISDSIVLVRAELNSIAILNDILYILYIL